MTCLGTLRRWLVRIGLYPDPIDVEVKEAETENLERDRSAVMTELAQHTESFKEHSDTIEATTDRRKEDLDDLLGHLRNINAATEAAHTLIERLFKSNKPPDPFT